MTRPDLDAYERLVVELLQRKHISLEQRADACVALLSELRALRADIEALHAILVLSGKSTYAQDAERVLFLVQRTAELTRENALLRNQLEHKGD